MCHRKICYRKLEQFATSTTNPTPARDSFNHFMYRRIFEGVVLQIQLYTGARILDSYDRSQLRPDREAIFPPPSLMDVGWLAQP